MDAEIHKDPATVLFTIAYGSETYGLQVPVETLQEYPEQVVERLVRNARKILPPNVEYDKAQLEQAKRQAEAILSGYAESLRIKGRD